MRVYHKIMYCIIINIKTGILYDNDVHRNQPTSKHGIEYVIQAQHLGGTSWEPIELLYDGATQSTLHVIDYGHIGDGSWATCNYMFDG